MAAWKFLFGKVPTGSRENSRENLRIGASRILVSISVLTFRLFTTSSSSTTTHYASLCMYDWCQLITVVLVLMPRDHIEIGGWLAPGALESNERWWGKHWKHGKTISLSLYIYIYIYIFCLELQYTCVCNSFLDSRRFRNIAAGNLQVDPGWYLVSRVNVA